MHQLVIGITTHREPEFIGQTIASVWNADLVGVEKRIIVCANDSNSKKLKENVEAIRLAIHRLNIPKENIVIIQRSISNRPEALNAILTHAWTSKSVALALITGDVTISTYALARLYNELKTNIRLEGVGASIHASRNRKLSENLADIPHQVAGFRYLDGKCLMMRGSAVPKIGHIPSTILNDDLFISLRLGIENVRRIPSARVVYHPPASIRETWKQAVRQWKGVLQLRKMFGRKRVNAFVNPSVLRAFQRGISAYSSLSSKQRMALWAAPVFYSAVKARSYLGRKGGGTWKMQKSTKRGTR